MSSQGLTVGVTVPVYGDPQLIEACLASIASQDEPFDSVTLVDDTCGDVAVHGVLQDFQRRNPDWIITSNSAPLGIVGSSNKGVEICRSDYVALVDCDDLLPPSAAKVLRSHIVQIDRPFIATRYATFSESQAPQDLCLPELRSVYASDLHLILEHMFLSHLKVVKRDWFLARGGFPQGTDGVQDWYLALDAVGNDEHALIDEVLYLHRLHEGQTSGTTRSRFLRLVNEKRRSFLRSRFKHRSLEPRDRDLIEGLAADINDQVEVSGQRPTYLLAGVAEGLIALPASVPILEILIAERHPAWVLIAGDTWLDLGQVGALVADRVFSLGILVQHANQASVDLARWYSGYLDFLVVPDEGQLTALRESIPHDLETLVVSNVRA